MEIHSLPTAKLLNGLFEFPVPSAFVEVLKAFWELSRESGQSVADLMDDLCGFYPAGEGMRYQQTPPELFPIGHPGVDGVHYGYVIHAPERSEDDYPIGEICPMDDTGVLRIGRSTQEAFEILLSGRAERQDARRIRQIAEKLGYEISAEKASLRFGRSGEGIPVEPSILKGELHVMTKDGIGVLADRRLFRPMEDSLPPVDYRVMDRVLERARLELEKGYPATALMLLREGYWIQWTDTGAIARYGNQMRDVYEALGRYRLAEVVQRRIRQFSK